MIKTKRASLKEEYEKVNSSQNVKRAVQTIVTVIDLLVLIILVWNMFHFFIPKGSWTNRVSGTSMYPTLSSGQTVYTDMSTSIGRGDIITLYVPEYGVNKYPQYDGLILIKRVIGVPGDRVIINENGITVNGELIDEQYLTDEAKFATYVPDKCNSVMLKDGEYFVLGDNRGNSMDSRDFGVVSDEDVLYKQAVKPTINFYLKLALSVCVILLNIFIYMLLEFVVTECAYALLLKFNKKTI